MSYCPFSNNQGNMLECRRKYCALAGNEEDGSCLIKKALQIYIAEHAVIIPEKKEPTDEELLHMYQRIANLPIQSFNYANASIHNENYNLVDPQDYVKYPLQGGL